MDLGTDGSLKTGGVTISNKGIDAGSKNITNVASGIVTGDDSDNTNAANIGDVKTLAGEAAKTEIGKLGSRDFAGDDGETVSRGLGESMKLFGGADTSKLTNGNIGVVKNAAGDGLDIRLSSELTGLTSVTTGNSTLNNDGLTINNSEGKPVRPSPAAASRLPLMATILMPWKSQTAISPWAASRFTMWHRGPVIPMR